MELEKGTSFMLPFSVTINVAEGIMEKPENHLIRRASDMKGHYADSLSLDILINEKGNPVHYEVFEVPVPEEYATSCSASASFSGKGRA
jgi:hypothetical protein